MGKFSSKDTVLLIDGYNVLGVNTSLTHAVEAITEESTPFGEEWEEHKYVGINKSEVTQEGFYDDDSGSINDALNEKQGEERILCIGYAGNTIGAGFSGFQGALQSNFQRIASRGVMHKANASYVGSGITEDGRILHALTARTTERDTKAAPVEHGTDTGSGGTAYLQVTALDLDGYDDVTIRVIERNGGSWATLATFADVDVANVAERVEVTGTVEQGLAVEWEFNGIAGTDPSMSFFVGFVRN